MCTWKYYRGRVCAFNQFYKSKNCHDVLEVKSKELVAKRNNYDNIEAYLKYLKKSL